jgi:DNA-binding transcriptional regulator YiaG
MKQIRKRLVALTESHDMNKCSGCPTCEEIKSLRKQIGFTKNTTKKKEEQEVAFEMSAEEFVDLRFVKKLSYLKIGKMKGVSDATIHLWKDKNKKEIDAEMERLNTTLPDKKAAVNPLENSDNTAGLISTIEELKLQLVKAAGKENASKNMINDLEAKLRDYQDIHSSHVEVDNELTSLRTENRLIRDLLRWVL